MLAIAAVGLGHVAALHAPTGLPLQGRAPATAAVPSAERSEPRQCDPLLAAPSAHLPGSIGGSSRFRSGPIKLDICKGRRWNSHPLHPPPSLSTRPLNLHRLPPTPGSTQPTTPHSCNAQMARMRQVDGAPCGGGHRGGSGRPAQPVAARRWRAGACRSRPYLLPALKEKRSSIVNVSVTLPAPGERGVVKHRSRLMFPCSVQKTCCERLETCHKFGRLGPAVRVVVTYHMIASLLIAAYSGTSLIRNNPSLGPYSRLMPRDLW